ncbi:unnamed protein product [Clonostachys byssicola]|uniref:Zn(2)-C6 fungal-type domain-containing protein n=1 Tax=Clonostachys byssicola TaxID=160290 RepID=A0A9N9U332_9HYPO|nr:unnamed protein product [Clonostachys byssicola]
MDAPDASSVRPEEDDVQSPATNEKLAIKCDRSTPCAHCVKVGVECSYASGPKPRERRQRVMVSNS